MTKEIDITNLITQVQLSDKPQKEKAFMMVEIPLEIGKEIFDKKYVNKDRKLIIKLKIEEQ